MKKIDGNKRRKTIWSVYMVVCSDETFYTGITTDIVRRVVEHNSSILGAKYTAMRRPVSLVYSKNYKNRSAASKEEFRIKHFTRSEKILFVKNNK